MAQQDVIDQFIAMPKEERGKLFEQLAPAKQQSLLAEIKKRKSVQPALAVNPPAQTQPQQEPSLWDKTKGFLDRSTQPIPDTPLEGDWWQKLNAAAYNVEKLPVNIINRTARGIAGIPGFVGQEYENIASGDANAALDMVDPGVIVENSYKGMQEDAANLGPVAALGNLGGDAATMYLTGKGIEVAKPVVGKVTRGLLEKASKAREGAIEGVTGTGPRVTKELVKKTQGENVLGAEKHGEKLQEHQTAVRGVRKGNVDALTDHIAKLDDVAKDRTAGTAILDAREGLQKSVKDATEEADVRTEKARHDALEEGNKKYNAVNPALNPIEANPEFMRGALSDALEALKGSKGEPTILKDIEQSMRTETPTYESLQGDYSRLGRELSKGTLPGDEFHAYDILHEAIGEEMQRIADSEGMGEQLKVAREYWRRMKQTFGKPFKQVAGRAGEAIKDANADHINAQDVEYTRRLLGSFDPEIPKLLDAVDKGTQRLKELPGETEGRKLAGAKPPEPPEPKPLPPEPKFEPKKLSTKDVQQAKEEALTKRVHHLTQGLQWGAGGMAVFRILADVAHGNLSAVPSGVLEGGMAIGAIELVSRLLENPRIVESLTRVTDKDIAAIPPEMRGDLKVVVEEAQKQGIKVDPKLAALVGVAAASPHGPKTQQLQKTVDDYRSNPR